MTLKRTLRYYYLRLRNLKGNPHSIACGMAIGVFIGLTPTIPFHTIMIILATSLFRSSRVAGIIGATMVSNPVTIPIHYYLAYRFGKWIISSEISLPHTYSIVDIAHTGWKLVLTMLSGGILLGVIPAVIVYFLTLYSFKYLKTKHCAKRLRTSP